jgi:glycosyltransferase involved in cell wall biosynthesis
MKIITLLPVKNEGWILRSTLRNMSDFSDHIVIADQKSTDDSLAIYQEFEKVQVIENKNTGHSNSVRWQLLDYARKTFGLGNIIVCVDADEMIRSDN